MTDKEISIKVHYKRYSNYVHIFKRNMNTVEERNGRYKREPNGSSTKDEKC